MENNMEKYVDNGCLRRGYTTCLWLAWNEGMEKKVETTISLDF